MKTQIADEKIVAALSAAIHASGMADHIDRLIDLVGAVAPHDLITVTRYSTTRTPEFVKHRRFSNKMVGRYLANYYVYDPFYAHWRQHQRLGIMPLKTLANDEVKRGKYIAEFLAQSRICDEVGIMLADGGDWCLGIFLDRVNQQFKERELSRLREFYPVFASLHALDIRTKSPDFMRTGTTVGAGALPNREPAIPDGLWTALSEREKSLVELILAGHPTATIAERLGIAVGTVKNHRRRIYEKLDITTERELFLQFFQHHSI